MLDGIKVETELFKVIQRYSKSFNISNLVLLGFCCKSPTHGSHFVSWGNCCHPKWPTT